MGISIPHPLPVMNRSLYGAAEISAFRNSNTKSNIDIIANCT